VALALLLLPGKGRVRVPDVIGQTEGVAMSKLRRAGLTPLASRATSATVANGVVLAERPPAGTVVGRGTRVHVVVSSGPANAAVINVEGLSAGEALLKLRAAGFKPTTRTRPSSTVAQGLVIRTDPPAGTQLQVGSRVTALVSAG